MPPEAVPETAPAWVTPKPGKGALDTRRSRRSRPFRTLSRSTAVNLEFGARGQANHVVWGWMRAIA